MTSPRDHAGAPSATPRVDAVVVTHDGERWIPHLLTSLEALETFPDRVLAVDSGSTDGSRALVADVLGETRVVDADRTVGFGSAVAHGIVALDAERPPVDPAREWLWLLHDDCAPAPDALERLLEIVAADPSVTVVGCRVRAWPRARRLLEVGVTITGTGHRETGLEPGEYDQGQHDGVRRVLAVSSAGMLVRRDQWDALGGFDRRLPLFRDDVDFGWRVARSGGRVVVSPDAVVFHAEAATRGVRAIANTSPSPHRADRKAALFTVLANCSAWAFPFQYVRLFLGSLVRAVGYLAGKLPGAALDEVVAAAAVAVRPDRLLAARWSRRRTASAPRRQVRALLPSWWTPYANGLDSVLSRFADTVRDTATTVAGSARRLRRARDDGAATDTGPVDVDAVPFESETGPLTWFVRHPALALAVLLTVVSLVATRGLWGSGLLQGGGLVPAPDGAADWWRLYGQAWHPVALGSSSPPSPYVVVLASLSTVLLGKAWLAVDLLMLLCVPLAALGAHAAARRLVSQERTRLWMAATYALLPVLAGAVTAGRIGTVVAFVVLPWLVVAVAPILDLDEPAPWRRAFATGIVLAVIAAFVPIAWVMAAVLVVLAIPAMLVAKAPIRIAQLSVALGTALVLLLPWSWRLLTDPSLVLTEAGVIDPSAADATSAAWQLPLGRLAAAGDAPWWLTVGIILAAVVALLRTDRRRVIAMAWVVLATGLVTAALLVGHVVETPDGSTRGWVWVGLPVLVAQAAAIVAAGLAADGITGFVEEGRFGWRQPLVAATAALALLAPVAGVLWWVIVAPHGELNRTTEERFPAYIVDGLRSSDQHRVLVLTGTSEAVDYDLVMDDGFRLGDDSTQPRFRSEDLDDVVADVLSEGQATNASRLARFGIAYVMLPVPADPDLVTALDGLPGLTRASTDPHQVVGWKVDQPAGLARLVDHASAAPGADASVLPAHGGSVDATVAEGSDLRALALAVPPDEGFSAQLDGSSLSATDVGGTIEFPIGAAGGQVTVSPPGHRVWWLVAEALVWVVAIVLATPSAVRREGIAAPPTGARIARGVAE